MPLSDLPEFPYSRWFDRASGFGLSSEAAARLDALERGIDAHTLDLATKAHQAAVADALVLSSPDGTLFQLTVSDEGDLSAEPISED